MEATSSFFDEEVFVGDQFAKDKEFASELSVVERMMQAVGVPDYIKDSLSVNASTVTVERTPPTQEQKIRALWDYWTFLDLIDFHGGSVAFSQCHKETVAWSLRPDASFRQLILEARGMLKSTLHCVGKTLWRVYQNPNIRMFVGTESLKLSKAFIREIEVYLTDEWLKQHVWNSRPHFDGPLIPEMDSLGKSRRALVRDISNEFGDELSTADNADKRKKVWRAEAIQVVRTRKMKEPTVVAGSVGQTSTGFHFDEIIFDDVHTFDNCSTEGRIDKVFGWIYDMESVLDPAYIDVELAKRFELAAKSNFDLVARWAISGGRLTVLGTRYSPLDYYGHVEDNKDTLNFEVHKRNIYANGVDNSDGYRWPEKWNEALEAQTIAQFQRKHGSTGLSRYYSQYHNKIVSFDIPILPWEEVKFINPASVKLDREKRLVRIFEMDGELKAEFRPSLIIDPTSTSSRTSDFCAMAVGGRYKGATYVVDFWMKRVSPAEWLDKMWELIDKWNLFEVTIEMVSGFKVLEYTIQQQWYNDTENKRPIKLHCYQGVTNQGEGKWARIEATLGPIVSNGLLHLPLICSKMDELKKQFIFFGKATTKDDGPDVLAMLQEKAYDGTNIKASRKVNRSVPRIHPVHGGVVYEDVERNDVPSIVKALNAA